MIGAHPVSVTCPYCGETVEILLEADQRGEMVQDCEVCCNPWRLVVRRAGFGGGLEVDVSRLDE